jgi:hypothetical protein
MQFQVQTKDGVVMRRLVLKNEGASRYKVVVDGGTEIGEVYKADGVVNHFRRHFLEGTKTVDRWFAKTSAGKLLGPRPPYEEGFSTRQEAVIDLMREVLKLKKLDPQRKTRTTD